MTPPRKVVPGNLMFITRRCLERRFFLHPTDGRINELILYLLAVGCVKYALEPVAFCAMSSHYHLIATDRDGRYPDFTQWFNSQLARICNRLRERRDRFWSGAPVNCAEVVTEAASLSRIAYVLANPVAAGLVEHGRDWLGVRSTPEVYHRGTIVVRRPEGLFSKRSKLPEEAELRFAVPDFYAGLTKKEFSRKVAEAVAELEAAERERVRSEGRSFIGRRGLRRIGWRRKATSVEAHGAGEMIHPHVVACNREALKQALAELKAFRRAYYAARERWEAGEHDTVFPAGTWKVRVRHGARCEPFGCHDPP